jgi:homocitrate synthase NifV
MIQSILRKDRKCLEAELLRCVEYASSKESEVSIGFQDASRADPEFMLALASAFKDFNICALRLADTVGILTPRATAELVGRFMLETEFAIGVHTHNDLGMAVATAVEAVKFGAMFVDTTMFGVGERAGNCDAFQFSHAMQPFYHIAPSFEKLTDQRARISELMKHVCKKNGWLTS